jgi:hypothetical protein
MRAYIVDTYGKDSPEGGAPLKVGKAAQEALAPTPASSRPIA